MKISVIGFLSAVLNDMFLSDETSYLDSWSLLWVSFLCSSTLQYSECIITYPTIKRPLVVEHVFRCRIWLLSFIGLVEVYIFRQKFPAETSPLADGAENKLCKWCKVGEVKADASLLQLGSHFWGNRAGCWSSRLLGSVEGNTHLGQVFLFFPSL